MSMEHKGYAFDWQKFKAELLPVLIEALETGEIQDLLQFIEKNRDQLTDPYDGMPLNSNWQSMLFSPNAHVYGDYALTKYYDVSEQTGVGYAWIEISDRLPKEAARALLGEALGPKHNLFDPGKMGSYFQQPEQVRISLKVLEKLNVPEIDEFRRLLSRCATEDKGVYVTF